MKTHLRGDGRKLPRFALNEYSVLIEDLLANDYVARPVEDICNEHNGLSLYLRHDVDLHMTKLDEMARIEAGQDVIATYYIPLTLPFNPRYPPNERIVHELVKMGHRIGLHYDLATYPDSPVAAREQLDREVTLLGDIAGVEPRTICMHNPSLGGQDFFRTIDAYVHPHDPRYSEGLVYVSDSCRMWRDEQLLSCFGESPPQNLLLNTHPELWLGTGSEKQQQFVEGSLLTNTLAQQREYVLEEVSRIWQARADEMRRSHTTPEDRS